MIAALKRNNAITMVNVNAECAELLQTPRRVCRAAAELTRQSHSARSVYVHSCTSTNSPH
jgi:GTP cyclohydrolase I